MKNDLKLSEAINDADSTESASATAPETIAPSPDVKIAADISVSLGLWFTLALVIVAVDLLVIPSTLAGGLHGLAFIACLGIAFTRRRGVNNKIAHPDPATTRAPMTLSGESHSTLDVRQKVISDLVQNALLGEDLGSLMNNAIQDVTSALDIDSCCILELQSDEATFLVRASVGNDRFVADETLITASKDSFPGHALQCVAPLVIERLADDDRIQASALEEMQSIAGGVCIVIEGSEDPYGVLCIGSTQPRSFAPEDVRFLHTVTNLLAGVIQQKKAEHNLRDSEERLALAAAGANDGLWDWNLRNGKVHYSERWKTIFGCTEDEIGDSPSEWFSRVASSDLGQLSADIEMHLSGKTLQLNNEHRIVSKDGTERWVLCRGVAVRNEEEGAVRIAGSLTDITARKKIEQALQHAAYHDTLTGLANRAALLQRIDLAIKRTHRHPEYKFAVIFLDFDRFKIVNDSLGHDIGDLLLKSIALRLGADLREVDLATRLGGDEFVIFLDGLEAYSDCLTVADRMLDTLAAPHLMDGHEINSTASIGIVTSEGGYLKADDVLRDADTGMYQAKEAGRSQYVLFDEKMREAFIERQLLETDLRKAIERDELLLHYQPIVSLDTGDLKGFEALVRWNKDGRTLIGPDKFIPIAEETGLIIPIGEWVLREACRQLQEWKRNFPDRHDLTMNINLSRRQINQPNIVETVIAILDETGAAPTSIKLEITETVIMDDRHSFAPTLEALRELGIALCMDDFGTGHSSLSCLHDFPLDVLKIDRSFIDNLKDNPEFSAIVHSIVSLAHNLDIQVVAEGIETAEQLAHLQALECDEAQGYYFARPMEAEKAFAYLTDYSNLRKSA